MRKKLNLTQSKLNEIKRPNLSKIKGGVANGGCSCGCCGTSSTADNAVANCDKGILSKCPPMQQ